MSPCAVSPEAVCGAELNQGNGVEQVVQAEGASRRLTVPKTKTASSAMPLEFPALMSQPPSCSLMSQLKAG